MCVLTLLFNERNVSILHASIALWLLLMENAEWFPSSLPEHMKHACWKILKSDWPVRAVEQELFLICPLQLAVSSNYKHTKTGDLQSEQKK